MVSLSYEAEVRLRNAVRSGKRIDLLARRRSTSGIPVKRTVRAGTLASVLLQADSSQKHRQRTAEVLNARITGRLDLSHKVVGFPILLKHCEFDHPVDVRHASLRYISLQECDIPEISGEHVNVTGDLDLRGVTVSGKIDIAGARIGHDIHLEGATVGEHPGWGASDHLRDTSGALIADHVVVQGNVEGKQLTIWGRMTMRGARVCGSVILERGRVNALGGRSAVEADSMFIEGDFNAQGMRVNGAVNLNDVTALSFVLRQARIKGGNGCALQADRLRVKGSVFCDGGLRVKGGFTAIGLQAGGSVYFDGARLSVPARARGTNGPQALVLDRGHIRGALLFAACDRGGARIHGGVSMIGLEVDSDLAFRDAALRPSATDGRALSARQARIGGNFDAAMNLSFEGDLDLMGAEVQGSLMLRQAGSDVSSLPVVTVERISVRRDLSLCTNGVLRASGTTVGGTFELNASQLRAGSDDECAADLSHVSAKVLKIVGPQPRAGLLDLTRAAVDVLRDDAEDWPAEYPRALNGLVSLSGQRSGDRG